MMLDRHILFWLAAAALFILAIGVLQDVLLPFVVGLGVAYFLDPVADRLERIGFSRLWATLLIVTFVAVLTALALIFLAPVLLNQLKEFAASLPEQLAALRSFLETLGRSWLGEDFAQFEEALRKVFQDLSENWTSAAAEIVRSLWSGGWAVVNLLSLILITPVVTFYLLLDWDRMIARIDSWLPRASADTIRDLARQVDDVIAGFVRGQGTVCLILAILYAVGLTWAGVRYGLLIGLGAGLLTFIPFVGTASGVVVASAVAAFQYWPDWVPLAKVVGVFATGQALEGALLSPRIVAGHVRLHPVWLIFALFVFGYLFGFVGLLVAVPVAASIGVLTRFALTRYLDSPIYRGEDEGEGEAGGADAGPRSAGGEPSPSPEGTA